MFGTQHGSTSHAGGLHGRKKTKERKPGGRTSPKKKNK
jgi:hypothetical protein